MCRKKTCNKKNGAATYPSFTEGQRDAAAKGWSPRRCSSLEAPRAAHVVAPWRLLRTVTAQTKKARCYSDRGEEATAGRTDRTGEKPRCGAVRTERTASLGPRASDEASGRGQGYQTKREGF
ncbi:hypothetical protein SESBI_16202 [Sesbania bispinosa]|nr:hypothetical protein SESBI_16202 [Sesbania bispinosa]